MHMQMRMDICDRQTVALVVVALAKDVECIIETFHANVNLNLTIL